MRASITLRRVCAAGWGHLQHVPHAANCEQGAVEYSETT
jgi:hypothetical protein